MKRKFKRIASLVLAAVMVFAMAMPAMAAEKRPLDQKKDSSECSITIDGVVGDDHTFNAYQIFKGDVYDEDDSDSHEGDGKDEVLSNIEWGSALSENPEGRTALAEAVYGKGSVPKKYTAAEVAKQLATKTAAQLEEIFKAVMGTLSDVSAAGNATKKNEDGNYVISPLTPGYYLVVDTAKTEGNLGSDDAYSSLIVEVVGNAKVTTKADVPTSEKKVKEKNDSVAEVEGTNPTDWQDAADYDIGDKVPFQLKGTVAENYADYDEYYFAFHDVEDPGLTFDPESVKVYVNGVEVAENAGYEVKTDTDDGCTFEIIFNDLKAYNGTRYGANGVDHPNVIGNSVITVEYESTLNEKAVVGPTGNSNTMHLEYSNNPQSDDHGTTTPDKVTVFTFKLDVDKVKKADDGDGTDPLEGAGFTLYKWDPTEGEEGAYKPVNVKNIDGNWTVVADGTPDAVTEITGDKLTKFVWNGLDGGQYKLEETTVPPGYNKAPDIEFTIVATYETKSDNPSLSNLEVPKGSISPEDTKFECTLTSGSVEVDILNQEGTTLPETGGIGTTIFYVVGSVLVLGAVILLVTKRRMKSE